MTATTPPDLAAAGSFDVGQVLTIAHKNAVCLPLHEQARFVVLTLGGRLGAGCLGLKDTRTLGSWARGGAIKNHDGEHRLQVLYRVSAAITSAYTPAVAAAFWRASNPLLGGRAPMLVLADSSPADVEADLLRAVEALLSA